MDDRPIGDAAGSGAPVAGWASGPLGAVQAADREIARQTAVRARAVAEFAASRPASADRQPGEPGAMSAARRAARPAVLADVSEWAAPELSIALGVSREAAGQLLERSLTLVHKLPATLGALESGLLHAGHLWALLERVAPVTDDRKRAVLEREVLAWMAGRAGKGQVTTPAQLGAKLRRMGLGRDPREEANELLAALKERGVWARPDRRPGMAALTALLTQPEAQAVVDVLGRYADALDDTADPADGRTRGQRMADVLLDLVLRPGESRLPPVQAQLTLVAGVRAVLGGGQAGEIGGEPVPAEMVRAVARALGLLPLPETSEKVPVATDDATADAPAEPVPAEPVPVGAAAGPAEPSAAEKLAAARDRPRGSLPAGWHPEDWPQEAWPAWLREDWHRVEEDATARALVGMRGGPDEDPPPQVQQRRWDEESQWIAQEPPDDDWWEHLERRLAFGSGPPSDDETAPPGAPAPDPEDDGAAEGGLWASARAAVDQASRALLGLDQALGRASAAVGRARAADRADERAWQSSPAGRIDAAGSDLAALAAATADQRAELAALLNRSGGGTLVDRPRIALIDELTGALLALTDARELRRRAHCGRPACTRRPERCDHDLTDRPGLGPPPPTDGYRPGPALDRYLRARDSRCRFPGCRRRVPRGGELDHNTSWPDGATSAENLTGFCTGDHRGKHQAPGWTYHLDPTGTLTVTTPTGMVATTDPPPF